MDNEGNKKRFFARARGKVSKAITIPRSIVKVYNVEKGDMLELIFINIIKKKE